jgi:hypothetical protein
MGKHSNVRSMNLRLLGKVTLLPNENLCKYQTTLMRTLKNISNLCIWAVNYNPECEYKATHKRNLVSHQKSVHMGQIFQCPDFEHKSTKKCRLVTHHQSMHMGKYSNVQTAYQATQKVNLITHQKFVYMGREFQCPDCEHQATMKCHLVTHQRSGHMSRL